MSEARLGPAVPPQTQTLRHQRWSVLVGCGPQSDGGGPVTTEGLSELHVNRKDSMKPNECIHFQASLGSCARPLCTAEA